MITASLSGTPDDKIKLLINASTIVKGGGLQAASAFIVHALDDPGFVWHFMISGRMAEELAKFGVDVKSAPFAIFPDTPARHAAARKRVREIERDFQPTLVFTFFGPAYVNFKAPHVCGVADPWVTHSIMLAFRSLGSIPASIRMCGLILWKAFWYLRASAWWVEAQVARRGLISRWRVDPRRIAVIPNAAGPQFSSRSPAMFPDGNSEIRILCLSAYYEHKNLELVPHVAKHLRDKLNGRPFRFILTLPPELPQVVKIMDEVQILRVGEHVQNLGPVPVTATPELYASSHVAFLPTLLEVSSAVYPESMFMGVPIVTTDLGFAHDSCGDAAAYFTPGDAEAAATEIQRLVSARDLWTLLVEKGVKQAAARPSPAEKYAMHIAHLRRVLAGELEPAE